MTVQTIPEINEMTATQQIELIEALWKNMSERNVNSEPPVLHLKYLEDCETAVAKGEDSFIGLDKFEEDLRSELKRRSEYFVRRGGQLQTGSVRLLISHRDMC